MFYQSMCEYAYLMYQVGDTLHYLAKYVEISRGQRQYLPSDFRILFGSRTPRGCKLLMPVVEVLLNFSYPSIADHIRYVSRSSVRFPRWVQMLHDIGKDTHQLRVGVKGFKIRSGPRRLRENASLGDVLVVYLCWPGLINILILQQEWKTERCGQVDVHLSDSMEDPSSRLVFNWRH